MKTLIQSCITLFVITLLFLHYVKPPTSTPKPNNHEAECVVGQRYTLYGPTSNNPFDPQAAATVVITDKRNGYVQYCWEQDYAKPDKALFSRSCKEFIESTQNHSY